MTAEQRLVSLWMTATCGAVVSGLDIHQGVIVQLFEWRYSDIAQECEDFLAPNGFAGVQTSPPSENLIFAGRPWWERYQPVSYLLTTRSGTAQDLADMLRRCNKVGIRVFPDVVFNHMTSSTNSCIGTGGSTCNSTTFDYPAVPYTHENFHYPPCDITDWYNTTQVRNCELVSLHDLNQTQDYVREKILNHLNQLIDLGVAGFRIDAAKHMWPSDLQVIYGRLHNLNESHGFPANTRPLIYQENVDLGGGMASPYQEYSPLGLVTDFRYGSELDNVFELNSSDLKSLQNFGSAWGLLPRNESIVFLENQDSERHGYAHGALNYKKSKLYKMAAAFMLAWPYGLPKLFSSYAFSTRDQGPPHDSSDNTISPLPINGNNCSNGWVCQHRWHVISNMVRFHNVVQDTNVSKWWDNGKNQIAFCRGNKGFIAFNKENFTLNETLQTCLPKGSYCDIISGNLQGGHCTGKTVQVSENGTARVIIDRFDLNQTEVDCLLAIHIQESGPVPSSAFSHRISWHPTVAIFKGCIVHFMTYGVMIIHLLTHHF